MNFEFEFWPLLATVVVLICWVAFIAIFLIRKTPQVPPEQKRDRKSIVGLILQALSYAVVGMFHRAAFTPISSGGRAVAVSLSLGAMLVAVVSIWIIKAALKTLGKEWSVTARVVKGHRLATEGPYRFVRHPIYTGMLGMLLATGLVFSHWLALTAAIVIYFIGTVIRINSEERLLREALGSEFDSYARSAPALVPGLY
jgi:protein-S-isoprenylcysteine O-methyltransferase Ste14